VSRSIVNCSERHDRRRFVTPRFVASLVTLPLVVANVGEEVPTGDRGNVLVGQGKQAARLQAEMMVWLRIRTPISLG
jgi:hypothetical protein